MSTSEGLVIRTIVTVISIAQLITVTLYPTLDLKYEDTHPAILWWAVFIFVVFNYIYPIIVLSAVTENRNPSRTDLYSVATIGSILLNLGAFIGCVACYLLYMNTSYSGASPFNDPKWCCVYYLDHPELCQNTLSCLPEPVLGPNPQFVILWIFSGVNMILAFVHLVLNRLLRRSGALIAPSSKHSSEIKIFAIVISLLYLAIFAYWCSGPLLSTLYINGYPTVMIQPGPGNFVTNLYSWQWVVILILTVNIFPPNVFLACLMFEKSHLVTLIQFWVSLFIGMGTSIVCMILIGIWVGDCNWFYSGLSICKDYKWCCVNFAAAYDICGNVTPCSASLGANPEFVQHVVISGVFTFFGFIMVWLNYRMQKYGVFK